MKIFIYLKVLVLYLILPTQMLYGQTLGINIDSPSPSATLDILSMGNSNKTKNLQIKNSNNNNLITLQDNGYIGIGTESPSVLLDLRSSSGDNDIIGIGDTDLSSEDAQAGALKYDAGKKELQFSDGSQWLIAEANAVRECILASNSYNFVNCPNNATTNVGSWDVIYNSTGTSFNKYTGVFTAPKEGLYTVSFTIHMFSGSVAAGSFIEGQWVSSNGATIKCTNSFPVASYFMTKVTCSGTLYLNVGDTVYPQIYHNMGSDKHPRIFGDSSSNPNSDLNFNTLSIVFE